MQDNIDAMNKYLNKKNKNKLTKKQQTLPKELQAKIIKSKSKKG